MYSTENYSIHQVINPVIISERGCYYVLKPSFKYMFICRTEISTCFSLHDLLLKTMSSCSVWVCAATGVLYKEAKNTVLLCCTDDRMRIRDIANRLRRKTSRWPSLRILSSRKKKR